MHIHLLEYFLTHSARSAAATRDLTSMSTGTVMTSAVLTNLGRRNLPRWDLVLEQDVPLGASPSVSLN